MQPLRNNTITLLLISSTLITSICHAEDPAIAARIAALENTVGQLNQAQQSRDKQKEGEEAQKQGNQGKAMEKLAQAAMLAASAAAMAAAAAGNKKRENQAKAADPIQTPAMPQMSTPPTPESSPLAMPSSTPSAEKEEEEEIPPAVVDSAPIPMPGAVAEAVPPEVAEEFSGGEAPLSTVPDSMPDPRTKLGYDETNPTGSSGAAQANYTASSGARGADSGASGGKGPSAGTLGEQQEKWAKNKTEPDADAGAGADGGGGGDSKSEGDSGGMMDMINSLMGKNGGEAGPTSMQGVDLVTTGNGKSGSGSGERKENIFEHASWRYQKLATDGGIKQNGALHRKMRAKEMASVLSRAGEIFSAVGHSADQ